MTFQKQNVIKMTNLLHVPMESPGNGAWNRELQSEQFVYENSDIVAEHFNIL